MANAEAGEIQNGLDSGKGKIYERGFYEYGDELGKGAKDLDEFLGEYDVLDLGAGRGKFAIDIELRKLREPEYKGPNVFSLNTRYADEDYKKDWLENFWKPVLEKESSEEKRALLRRALGKAMATPRQLAYNWDDLEELIAEGRKFKRIVSCNAFPHYSDFITETPGDGGVTHFSIGEKSKKVFRNIVALMADAGKGLFTIDWDAEAGIPPTEFLGEVGEFFASLGVKAQMYRARMENTSYVLDLEKL